MRGIKYIVQLHDSITYLSVKELPILFLKLRFHERFTGARDDIADGNLISKPEHAVYRVYLIQNVLDLTGYLVNDGRFPVQSILLVIVVHILNLNNFVVVIQIQDMLYIR